MPQFLRDEFIKNINVDESLLQILNQYFISTESNSNKNLPGIEGKEQKMLFVNYIIRFDQKGYRFFDFKEILKLYNQARHVERIIITLESIQCRTSNREFGTCMEVRLDAKDINNCFLLVQSDDDNWVESVFTGVKELIIGNHNKSGIIRNIWTPVFVQIFGLIIGFVLSVWAAKIISSHLSIGNAFFICFIFIFLIFSNFWTIINQQITKALNYTFPNLRFKRKGKETINWLAQALVGGIFVAITLFILSKIFEFVGSVISGFIK